MLFGMFAFILLVITGWVVSLHRPKQQLKETHLFKAEGMRFIIPLRERISMDSGEFVQHSIDLWGEENALFCLQMEYLKKITAMKSAFSITDFTHWAVFKVFDTPMELQRAEKIINLPDALTPAQQEDLHAHKATLVIEAVYGSDDPLARAQFAIKVLMTILRFEEALGCVVQAYGGYWPKEAINAFQGKGDLATKTLLQLLTHTEQFRAADGYSYMTHLHGMEQFGLPDLRVKFSNWDDADYYRDLIESCAITSMQEGEMLIEAGEIAELVGDGIIYRINEVPLQERKHFGRYGVLALVRISNAACLTTLN